MHDFITEKQANFFKNRKEKLKEDEVLAIMDFSENIAFEMQNAAQSCYYSKIQATIHPICMYYKTNGELEQKSMIIIAQHKDHLVESVYLFQSKLVEYVKSVLKKSKIIFFSMVHPANTRIKIIS